MGLKLFDELGRLGHRQVDALGVPLAADLDEQPASGRLNDDLPGWYLGGK